MKNLIKIAINLITNTPKLSLLIIFYIALRDIAIFVPYLNLFTRGLENRLAIVWLLALIMYRFSQNSIVTWILIFLLLSMFGIHVGLIIYVSSILIFFKHLRGMR